MGLVVGEVIQCEIIPSHENLKDILVNIGDESVKIITNAPNIRIGSRTVIATLGTELEVNGEIISIKKQTVGGRKSEGIVCDSKMCGWSGGASGVAVQIPDQIPVGSPCPASKPRGDGFQTNDPQELTIKEKKELEKAEKKRLAKEKREAKKALKNAAE
jgi:tRNA-binding EMAP/Myf-like protein